MNDHLSRSFGAIIRELRTEKNLSQEELAFKARVHRTYIGMIERGEKNITIENIEKLAVALDTSMSIIFGKLESFSK